MAHEECIWYAQNAFKRQKERRNGCRYHVHDDESEKIWSQQEGEAFEFSFQKQKAILSNQKVQKDSYCLYTQTDQLYDYDVAKHNQKRLLS